MSVVDDARLLELAAHRPKDVFPILERAASLTPLVLVLTVVPGIMAIEAAALSERDAQWRLKALELSTVVSPFDAVDPAAASGVAALKYQPPLASWLLAAGDRWLPFDCSTLPLFEYLAAACLVPACFLCMSRVAGRRVGLITAAVAAFHGTFLAQYRHAGPQALAVSAALFAFWGFFGHVWRASEIVSFDLLIGGLALGVCLLAGGPLALVVVAILFLVSLTRLQPFESREGFGRTSSTAVSRGRGIRSRWHAVRSLGVMTATAFAAGGWWELMMLYSYGREFAVAWFFGIPVSIPGPAPAETASVALALTPQLVSALFAAGGGLAGLTVLGLWIAGRRMFASRKFSLSDKEPRTPFTFVTIWFAGSCVMFTASLIEKSGASLYTGLWRLFFSAACVSLAALAFDEVIRRKVSLFECVCLTLAGLGCAYAFLHGEKSVPGGSLRGAFIALAAALVAARVAQEFCRRGEVREWAVIAGLLGSFVLCDAGMGISALETADTDYQALRVFARSLVPDHVDAEVCLVISETPPPARLLFVVKSIWPTSQVVPVRDWDEALKIAAGDGKAPKTAVVIDWSRGNSRPANPTGARWNAPPIGNPQFIEHRPLRAYVLVWE